MYLHHKNDSSKSKTRSESIKDGLVQVMSSSHLQDNYDVIVVGTDPEGISAALSSARNGLKTLLVDGRNRDRLGGLMTIGWLNTIDMDRLPAKSSEKSPEILNKGIFLEWYSQIEGDSFDVITAANVFYQMIRNEPNLDLLMKVKSIDPLTGKGKDARPKVEGIKVVKETGRKRLSALQRLLTLLRTETLWHKPVFLIHMEEKIWVIGNQEWPSRRSSD
ncbi:FAD-dependent oxidoreductase [Paenibacillus larvae]|nr:FAD-dependent oxidoreductase [Paenibacillus larvae]MDT2241925.1 FAD-dependent oxidoreductase [Paenibacillus larvae]